MTTNEPDDPIVPDSVVQGSGLPPEPDDGAASGPGDSGDPLAALLGSDGGLDLGSLMEQAGSLQSQMLEAQEQLQSAEVEGAAGGGAVRIVVTGGLEFRSVTIDPSAVDPAEVDMLQDLVLAALNDAIARINELQDETMQIGGMNFGDLFGQ